jgi:hypothetical protein
MLRNWQHLGDVRAKHDRHGRFNSHHVAIKKGLPLPASLHQE